MPGKKLVRNPLQVNCMMWYAIVFVISFVLLMLAAGYYLVRSFFRDYTYDAPSKAYLREITLVLALNYLD